MNRPPRAFPSIANPASTPNEKAADSTSAASLSQAQFVLHACAKTQNTYIIVVEVSRNARSARDELLRGTEIEILSRQVQSAGTERPVLIVGSAGSARSLRVVGDRVVSMSIQANVRAHVVVNIHAGAC